MLSVAIVMRQRLGEGGHPKRTLSESLDKHAKLPVLKVEGRTRWSPQFTSAPHAALYAGGLAPEARLRVPQEPSVRCPFPTPLSPCTQRPRGAALFPQLQPRQPLACPCGPGCHRLLSTASPWLSPLRTALPLLGHRLGRTVTHSEQSRRV